MPVLLVGIFPQPDDFGNRIQGDTRIDGLEKAAIGIAKIGDGIERDVGNGLAEHNVEHQKIVDRRLAGSRLFAKGSDDCTAKRGPNNPLYSAMSPTVIVRGVAWQIAGRGGNPQKNCRGLFSWMTTRSRTHSFISAGAPFSQNREPNASLRQRGTDEHV